MLPKKPWNSFTAAVTCPTVMLVSRSLTRLSAAENTVLAWLRASPAATIGSRSMTPSMGLSAEGFSVAEIAAKGTAAPLTTSSATSARFRTAPRLAPRKGTNSAVRQTGSSVRLRARAVCFAMLFTDAETAAESLASSCVLIVDANGSAASSSARVCSPRCRRLVNTDPVASFESCPLRKTLGG